MNVDEFIDYLYEQDNERYEFSYEFYQEEKNGKLIFDLFMNPKDFSARICLFNAIEDGNFYINGAFNSIDIDIKRKILWFLDECGGSISFPQMKYNVILGHDIVSGEDDTVCAYKREYDSYLIVNGVTKEELKRPEYRFGLESIKDLKSHYPENEGAIIDVAKTLVNEFKPKYGTIKLID